MTTYEWPMTGGNLARTGETVEIVNPPLRKIWEFEPDAMIQSSPAISRDLVFFGSGYASKHGSFYALEAHSGQLVWTFETAGMITSSPCISEGIVYFGSWNKKFYALEARSGKIIWEFQ